MKCRRCDKDAHHYLGGGIWVCFRHWLAAFGLVKECVHVRIKIIAAVVLVLTTAGDGRADPPFVKHGHYIQLCGDPTNWKVCDGPECPWHLVKDVNMPVPNPRYDWRLDLWVCGRMLVPGAHSGIQAWVDDSVEFDGSR